VAVAVAAAAGASGGAAGAGGVEKRVVTRGVSRGSSFSGLESWGGEGREGEHVPASRWRTSTGGVAMVDDVSLPMQHLDASEATTGLSSPAILAYSQRLRAALAAEHEARRQHLAGLNTERCTRYSRVRQGQGQSGRPSLGDKDLGPPTQDILYGKSRTRRGGVIGWRTRALVLRMVGESPLRVAVEARWCPQAARRTTDALVQMITQPLTRLESFRLVRGSKTMPPYLICSTLSRP